MDSEYMIITMIIITQIYCIVISVNILANKVFSTRFIVIVGALLGMCGDIVFPYIQYYVPIAIAVLFILILRWKKKRWLVCIVAPLLTLLLLVVITYYPVDMIFRVISSLIKWLWNYDILTNIILANIVYCAIFPILTYIVSTVVSHLIRSTSYVKAINKNAYVLVSIIVITVFIVFSFIYIESLYKSSSEVGFINGIIFVILLSMIVGTTFVFSKINQARINIEKQKMEQEQLTKYTLALEKLSNEMSDFNHDYINILASLHGYIEKGDQLLLKNYFQETIKPLNQVLIKNKNQLSEYTNRKDLTQ
ncbi:hypothetical protein PGRAN_13021 [Listeria grandensis FSL F6-0971]|uniref:Accessory gene regulator protein C n=1 Tax=Listeria grandensis FSL F6-0971 TaxID=1265819 RepID=W7BCR6_9LIST|nr:hypothetical protein [Listeria grandensis]EUJ22550.1 hypothetical protein PGRAN_13021 [Listeria grandensis FSL F6-0971]